MPQLTISLDEYNELKQAKVERDKLTLEGKALVKSYREGEEWHELCNHILNIEAMVK